MGPFAVVGVGDGGPCCGLRSSSRFQLDLEPRANTVRWSGRAMRARMAVLHAFRSSPWRVLWLQVRRGRARFSCHGGAARASIRGSFGRLAARDKRSVMYFCAREEWGGVSNHASDCPGSSGDKVRVEGERVEAEQGVFDKYAESEVNGNDAHEPMEVDRCGADRVGDPWPAYQTGAACATLGTVKASERHFRLQNLIKRDPVSYKEESLQQ